jgi:hypothetical protein
MKSFLILIVGLFLFKNGGLAQCSNGQSPSSSFPLCASNTFSQSIVPTCPGTPIPVPACSGAAVTFDDRNPYYYKFTAFQAQPFVFTITPLTNSDDYDWQLFDVTGKNPSDIYTDASMFVCCNWSGNTGKTGTSINATTANSCEGNAPNITKAPTLIKDHDYILLISHFTANGQSGYNLSISNASGLVDTTAPTVKNITANCVANQILVKLNKKMKCNSITASGSEFNITNNPIIASVEGFECANGFDTDSIIISLASPLPNGNYSVKIKNGTDGNTVLDNCDNGIPVNQSFDFAVVGASQPTLIDSIKTINCEPTSIEVVFKAPIKCNAVDISDFEISGASAVNIVAATVNCGSNGLGNTVTLLFSNPITATGLYKLNIRLGNDGNTILNQCDVATPEGTFIDFNVFAKPSADFTTQIINETCKADTLIYSHNINNSVNKWFWTFDGLPANSTLQSQQVIYNSFNNRVVTLAVYNAACTATITKNIAIADHLLIPKINASRDTTCPNNPETFIDSSKGNIISRFWDFANGQTSTSATPPTQI